MKFTKLIRSLSAPTTNKREERGIEWALDHYRAATLTFLVALMAGALRAPAIQINDANPEWTAASAGGVLVAAIVGAAVVLVLDATTDDLDY